MNARWAADEDPAAPSRSEAVAATHVSAPRRVAIARDSIRVALRTGTADAHRRLDAAMAAFDLADIDGYRGFLQVHHTALTALSSQWAAADEPDFGMLLDRCRDDLGYDVRPKPPATLPTSTRDDRAAGIAYVVRGSRFGAALLARRVPAPCPTGYLDAVMTLTWPTFVTQLESRGASIDEAGMATMLDAAHYAFDVFAAAVASHRRST